VPEGVDRVRADKLLAQHFSEVSRGQLQNVFDAGGIFLNGEAISKKHKLSSGQVLRVALPEVKIPTLSAVDLPVSILYEDEAIVVVNKAAGQVVHPGVGTADDTLVHALLHHTGGQLSTAAGDLRTGVVHRLDKETSGAIIFAKTDVAYFALVKAFAERTVQKEYLALVQGVPRLQSGRIEDPIGRHPVHRVKMAVRSDGKPAHTDWAIEENFGSTCALLRCWLHTGRTHQIRVHLSHLGHPLLGDPQYGYRHRLGEPIVSRVLLHAHKLSFEHPVSQEPIHIEAPLPEDLVQACNVLRDAVPSPHKTH
jgi:23S rRNA pseudouridine1911/1915/1917 synthase